MNCLKEDAVIAVAFLFPTVLAISIWTHNLECNVNLLVGNGDRVPIN